MSGAIEAYGTLTAQARRFACDRCRKHKLRCERIPLMGEENLQSSPSRMCKRCEKAQVPCHTTDTTIIGTTENNNNVSAGSKRKIRSIENEQNSPASNSTTSNSLPESETGNFGLSQAPFFVPSTGTTSEIDLTTFEFDADSFDALELLTPLSSTSLPHPKSGTITCQPPACNTNANGSADTAPYEIFTNPAALETLYPAIRSRQSTNFSPEISGEHTHDSHDDCRKRLVELHSLIFDRLHRVTETGLVKSLMATDNTILQRCDGGEPPTDIVGCVLLASERLIELLRSLNSQWQSSARPSSSHSASFSATRYGGSLLTASSSGFLRRPLFPSPEGPVRRNSDVCRSTSSLSSSAPNVDLPVIASFLSCYIGLLSVYRTIFAQIYETLRVGDCKRALLDRPETPLLNHEHVLRIRIRLEVMTHMLDRIGRGWAKFASNKHNDVTELNQENSSTSDRVAAIALLRCMLMHEGYECKGEGLETGLASLELAIENIRRKLRSDRFSR
ncbi:hypothetical protein NUW58_g6332 [Xylaria curta]|uniref:Uncharacterized protein n=1 Tax=Xylaria curta TaxID=42375 RepID=A0ACC1NWP3_9PEZI|nr:hypothetical protein NUW58_g6332 [Xylaria curta]